MISVSSEANPNYLAKVIKVEGIKKHPNADRLQVLSVDFQNVITGSDMVDGDICVFFPLESEINSNFLRDTNSFRDSKLNKDETAKGFFEKNCRVRAVKLRGEKSMGYIVPVKVVEEWAGSEISGEVGKEFDTINGIKFVKKYEVAIPVANNIKVGKKPRVSRLVEDQVRLHIDTENLRKNAYKITPESNISITYKMHGTSFWVANVLVKKQLSLFSKILSKIGVPIETTEYDYVYGSRKVVKNGFNDQKTNDFYDSDLWGTIAKDMFGLIPKNITIYGECVGYTGGGSAIQPMYDYGCDVGAHKNYVYRVTFTTADGLAFDFTTHQMMDFCERAKIDHVPLLYSGKAGDLFPDVKQGENWTPEFMKNLEAKYNGKKCFMSRNDVPEEGVVVRLDDSLNFEAYKLKSFEFLEFETKMLDEQKTGLE